MFRFPFRDLIIVISSTAPVRLAHGDAIVSVNARVLALESKVEHLERALHQQVALAEALYGLLAINSPTENAGSS